MPLARSINIRRVVILSLVVPAGLVALELARLWLPALTPYWLIRRASIVLLWSMLIVYVPVATAIVIGGGWSLVAVVREWRRRENGGELARRARLALLAVSCFAALLVMEVGSATRMRLSRRIPALPTRFAQSTAASDGLYIVVVGASSAQGEPYQPWLSVGQLVAWQLERVFPGRPITIDIRAAGGLVLEQAILRLGNLSHRPDAILVFAGHNEFQTRFGWSRNVSYYADEWSGSPLAVFDRLRAMSSTCKLILESLDRYYGQTPPKRKITRELVDHPICTPKEHAFLREDFRARLDALAAYCERIGCLPILIVPGSNDGSFEPNRSFLSASTPENERVAFAREFEGIRAAEARDVPAAIIAYRRFAERQPEFAEVHYRLARLLAATGAWDEAGRHFALARDHDGFPLRCPTDFRDVIRSVAMRHGAVLIDGPEVLARVSPHGFLDEHLYHDAHHPNVFGTVALANDALEQLERRRAFGWPESVPAPHIEPVACARHFELDSDKWAQICSRSSTFYSRTSYIRFDPSARTHVAEEYERASLEFAAGRVPPESDLADLGIPVSIVLSTGADHDDQSVEPTPTR